MDQIAWFTLKLALDNSGMVINTSFSSGRLAREDRAKRTINPQQFNRTVSLWRIYNRYSAIKRYLTSSERSPNIIPMETSKNSLLRATIILLLLCGLGGALVGWVCAGLTEPSGHSKPRFIYSDDSGIPTLETVSYVPRVVFLCGTVAGFCSGIALGAALAYVKARRRRASGTPTSGPNEGDERTASALRAGRQVSPYPAVLFLLVAMVAAFLCYMACTKHLVSIDDGNGHVKCVTILHHRELGRLLESLPWSPNNGELDSMTRKAILCLAGFIICGTLGAWYSRRYSLSRSRP
jgi:hypothetical protein